MKNTILTCFVLGVSAASITHAEDLRTAPTSSTNSAAAIWVLFNEEEDQRAAPNKIKSFLCLKSGICHVPENNVVNVEFDAPLYNLPKKPRSFDQAVDEALAKLDDSPHPTLYLAIYSHGDKGRICQQRYKKGIQHEQFASLLFNKIDRFQKFHSRPQDDIRVVIFYSACYSGSILPYIQNRANNSSGSYFHKDKRYKYKIDLITSTTDSALSVGTQFTTALDVLNDSYSYFPRECSSSEVALEYLGELSNDVQFWSSYRDFDSSSQTIVAVISAALEAPDMRVRQNAAIALLRISERLGKDAIPPLVAALRNSDSFVRSSVATALGNMGSNAGQAVLSLAQALHDESSGVRGEAARTLGKIGKESAIAIPSLEVTINQDTDLEVRLQAVRALDKIGREAIPVLQRTLGSSDLIIRKEASSALEKSRTENSANNR